MSSPVRFNTDFWFGKLQELGYPLEPVELDVPTLRDQGVLSSDFAPSRVVKLVGNDYVEVALIEAPKLTRGISTKTARAWKSNRLGLKPLLILTDGEESYTVIVPGKGIGGEAKIFRLSDRLYHTDYEVLESMSYPGDAEALNKSYDLVFFPYDKVREEFFEGYRDLYQKVEAAVKKELKGRSSEYAQRFLGRLMFLYFLQRKGWLKRDGKGDKQFVNGVEDYRDLNKLFYESFNQEDNPDVPFLNGSLFEREEYLDSDVEDRLFRKMDELFKKAREFFNQYNFTVDEASPQEVEVSIDPALIGTVFENMLPEHERGSKGVFYTPRNEISFICRRALVNWLGLKDEIRELPGGKREFVDGLDAYLNKMRELKSERDVRALKGKLLSAKVLDPAVGSGGFILGMMQEIIHIIHEAEATVGWKTDPEELKNSILRNLYGFDIEPEAIEIARLRLWLSLIIDQKVPEPLPNLDMNLVEINDSLAITSEKQVPLPLVEKVNLLKARFNEIKEKYLHEHDPNEKKRLKNERFEVSRELEKSIGLDPNVIEASMYAPADLVVMNPPYVRQESIPDDKKAYYVEHYGLDKKSDLFAYFLVRALNLLAKNGFASVISSDKWLETGYGVSLQKKLKDHLIAVYGQKERTFGADINTVISVYGKDKQTSQVQFTYIERYGEKDVRRSVSLDRKELTSGKWFYLRAPRVFMEKILPKLTNKLGDFAEVKRGFTTGANDFFYMKDISHLYEADRLSNPEQFKDVPARTVKELEKQGLIYIENEAEVRYIINRDDVVPFVRSLKYYNHYKIDRTYHYCLQTKNPGSFTKKYIKYGENKVIFTKKGILKEVKGYHNLSTIKNRKPWYYIPNVKKTNIILSKSIMDRLYVPIFKEAVYCDCNLYYVDPYINKDKLWYYMNSLIYFLLNELYGYRMGGGALAMMVQDYKNIPTPNINNLSIHENKLYKNEVKRYTEYINNKDKLSLEQNMLSQLNIESSEEVVNEIKDALNELINDRIIKASRVFENEAEEEDIE
jgi:type II restriction/modification system DNA methylase subunit YeeA